MPRCNISTLMFYVAAGTSICNAQNISWSVDARMEFQVATPGGEWASSVTIAPGERVEWRVMISYTGTQPAAALGRVFYQPLFSNADNVGEGTSIDQLGSWRNGGISGQNNTTLRLGLLTTGEGESTSVLDNGYGRVAYGFTSRSTTSSGPLVVHRHSTGSLGAPQGEWMRVAGSRSEVWYPYAAPASIAENNRILWGVVSDNNQPTSTWFLQGTQSLTIFRHAFIASTDIPQDGQRTITLVSEQASLRHSSPQDFNKRYMTWAAEGEGGTTASLRSFVDFVPATINIVPAPGALLLALALPIATRRTRQA